jgi:hypothetical protein
MSEDNMITIVIEGKPEEEIEKSFNEFYLKQFE